MSDSSSYKRPWIARLLDKLEGKRVGASNFPTGRQINSPVDEEIEARRQELESRRKGRPPS